MPTVRRSNACARGSPPTWCQTAEVAGVVAFMALIAGDLPTAIEMNEVAAAELPDAPARVSRIVASAERLSARGRPDREGVTDLVESTQRLPSTVARATGYTVAAMAALVADPERAGELAHRSLELLPQGSSLWLGAYQPRAVVAPGPRRARRGSRPHRHPDRDGDAPR